MKRESAGGAEGEAGGVDGGSPAGGEHPPPRRNRRDPDRSGYTRPCAVIARATLMNPAMLAPTTKFPGEPNSSAASKQSW
jgi:hypothetical protein